MQYNESPIVGFPLILFFMNEKDFKIQSYGFGELARMFCPKSTSKSANETLNRWIKLNKQLNSDLKKQGFYPGLRNLSPKMVELIVVAIGEP